MLDNYIKISKYVAVHKDEIECICPYGKGPQAGFVKSAKSRDCYNRSHQKRILSLIIMSDGRVYTGPSLPKTYVGKLDSNSFLRTGNGAYIRDSFILEQVFQMNQHYRGKLKEKKTNGEYLNLSGNKTAHIYTFMKSGYVYGCRSLKDVADSGKETGNREKLN